MYVEYYIFKIELFVKMHFINILFLNLGQLETTERYNIFQAICPVHVTFRLHIQRC